MFVTSCAAGEIFCSIVVQGSGVYESGVAIISTILLWINYVLYKNHHRNGSQAILPDGYSVQPLQVVQVKLAVAWYFVPVFLGIIGGVIMYFAVKDNDNKMAKKGPWLGILLTIALIALVIGVVIF